MRRAATVVLCLWMVALATTGLRATTAVERTETDLIQEAELIIVGRVDGQESRWIDKDLVTLVAVSVTEAIKGAPGAQVTVVVPGGVDTSRPVPVAMTYPAAPELLGQENVLLFLTSEGRLAGGYSIVGFSQGKYTVVESAGGEKVATQNLGELNLRGRSGQVTRGTAKAISLRQLRLKVEETLEIEKQ